MEKTPKPARRSPENVVAFVYLLIAIFGTMLLVHFMQPAGQETATSSTSSTHESSRKSGDPSPGAKPAQLSLPDVHRLLNEGGYQEIRGLRLDDTVYRAVAIKGGRTHDVEVDAASGAIRTSPAPHAEKFQHGSRRGCLPARVAK